MQHIFHCLDRIKTLWEGGGGHQNLSDWPVGQVPEKPKASTQKLKEKNFKEYLEKSLLRISEQNKI